MTTGSNTSMKAKKLAVYSYKTLPPCQWNATHWSTLRYFSLNRSSKSAFECSWQKLKQLPLCCLATFRTFSRKSERTLRYGISSVSLFWPPAELIVTGKPISSSPVIAPNTCPAIKQQRVKQNKNHIDWPNNYLTVDCCLKDVRFWHPLLRNDEHKA